MRPNYNNNSQIQHNLSDHQHHHRHNNNVLNDLAAHSPKANKQQPFRQLQQHLQHQLQQQQPQHQQQQHQRRAPGQTKIEDVANNRGGNAKHSQQRKPSHAEKPLLSDLIHVPQAPNEGASPLGPGHRKKSSGPTFYHDKLKNASPMAVKNDRSFVQSDPVDFADHNQTNNQSGNYAPIQTDSESADGCSPLRQRRHNKSFHDSEDISSSSPSGANQAFAVNVQKPVRNTPRDRKQSMSNWLVPAHILDDLCCRFIINIPEEERTNHVRIFFQIELAYWFYLDFFCQDDPTLKPLGMRDFSRQVFTHCPTLSDFASNVDSILEEWREYKMAVPTYGAILLDESLEYILLAQGFWAKASWGFPKGKVNEEEAPAACAIREVYEETGFDISALVDETSFIERSISDQFTRLYIVKGVSLDTRFHPKTRKEIRSLEWFRVDQLPTHKRDLRCKEEVGIPPNSFFMVIPFVREIRRWIRSHKNLGNSSSDDDQGLGILGPPPLMNPYDAQPYQQRNDYYRGFHHQSRTPHRRIDLGSDSGKGPSPPAITPDHAHQRHPHSGGQPRSQRSRDVRRGISSPSDGGRNNNLQNNNLQNNNNNNNNNNNDNRNRHPSNNICVNLFSDRNQRGEGSANRLANETSEESVPSKFPSCKAWENFQLDVNQIMASFAVAS